MKTYKASGSHLFCGHWNGSPLEIGFMPQPLMRVPRSEALHYHDYHEYYVMLEGRAELQVEGASVALRANTVVMVQPGEKHRVVWVDPQAGARWVIIKERSEPDSKHLVSPTGS